MNSVPEKTVRRSTTSTTIDSSSAAPRTSCAVVTERSPVRFLAYSVAGPNSASGVSPLASVASCTVRNTSRTSSSVHLRGRKVSVVTHRLPPSVMPPSAASI